MKDKSTILKAKRYSDLFNDNVDVAKREFREYCKKYHPDVDDSPEAQEVFAIIQELYNFKLIKNKAATTNITSVTFRNKKEGKGFDLTNPTAFSTGICKVYHTITKVVLVYNKTYEKFYNNYISRVENLKYADKEMEKEFKRYFPKILKYFETDEDELCILLDKTPEVINLGEVVKAYDKLGKSFPEKQAAWILNRLYNIICYTNYNKLVFNGMSLDNLWVSPEMHTILPFGGWEYTTRDNEEMIGLPKDVYRILPIQVKDTKRSNVITDLESVKSIGRILYKQHSNLSYINDFLRTGTKSNKPWEEWQKYGEAVKSQFGKREFIIWEDVPYI